MNIVYACREFGPVTGGGIGTYIYNVCRSMAHRGHGVFLLTDCFCEKNMDLLPEGVTLVPTLPTPGLRRNNFLSPHHEYSYRVLDTLRDLARKTSLDVVEFAEFGVEGFAAVRAKRLQGEFGNTKLICKLHTPSSLLYHINEDKRLYPDIVIDCMMEDYCVRHADMVTSPSLSLAEYFEKRVGRTDIRQCPYPMDLPARSGERNFTDSQVRRVRFIGSVQVRKGLDTFIEAARLILAREPDFRFEIWGADRNALLLGRSYIDILKQSIPQEYTDNIVFCGSIPYHEIPALFSESCFCVYPSRWENWANVCLEAMSCGCVVIASKEGGMGEMIEHATSGFVVDPLKPEEIAGCILDNFRQVEQLHRISGAAQLRSREICEPEATTLRIEENYSLPWRKKSWKPPGGTLPLVSVVIPYFNQPQYVREAVASVQASSYASIEIVVVNDGSTFSEADEVFEQLEGVVRVRKRNGGLSSARNAGIAAATGDFILPLDADDTVHPDYIRRGVEALINNGELGYVSCHARNFGELDSAYIPVGYVPGLMLFMNTDGKCTNLFRRELFETCGGYDEIMTSYEDWDFLITLHEHGIEGDVLPDELFNYRRHFDSMVYSVANRQRADLVQYMMMKHEQALQEQAPRMAILLSRLWKETEMQHEFASQQIINQALRPDTFAELEPGSRTRLQVYSQINRCYWEHNSVYIDYPAERWLSLSLNLPFAGQEGIYRFDPSNRPGTVFVHHITIRSRRDGRVIFHADAGNGFAGCDVQGCDKHAVQGSCLVMATESHDPQVILPPMPGNEQSVELSATLYFTGEKPEDPVGICSRAPVTHPLKKTFQTLARRLF